MWLWVGCDIKALLNTRRTPNIFRLAYALKEDLIDFTQIELVEYISNLMYIYIVYISI